MVAQTKADARIVADKPIAAGKKGVENDVIVDNKDLLDDQVAAAAVVDAEQAVAAEVVADSGILPTEAPTQSIGELAQATTPTTTDTTTTTTPAPVAEEGATTMSPWAIGGIALLGVGAIALAADSGDDDDNPVAAQPPAAEPPAAEPPAANPPPAGPPANVPPTGADKPITLDATDNSTAVTATDFGFADTDGGTLQSVTIGAITPTAFTDTATMVFDEASGHGYQFVGGGDLTWAQANAAAIAAGGHLLVADSAAELGLMRDSFAGAAADGLGAASGLTGTWVGLTQATTGATTPGEGWAWESVTGVQAGGAAFPGDSALWNAGEPNDLDGTENGEDQSAAIYQGTGATDTALIYDWNTTLPNYIVEYEGALTLDGAAVAPNQVIALADMDGLSWNSVFNTGGTVAFNVTDSGGATSAAANTLTFAPAAAPVTTDAGPSQSISTLIEDQHLTALA